LTGNHSIYRGTFSRKGRRKIQGGARLGKPRGGVIWLIHGFSTIILTIANFFVFWHRLLFASHFCQNKRPGGVRKVWGCRARG
jgi:hypothetical protein